MLKKNVTGFTLLEVVIALLMFGICVAGLFNLELVLTRGVGFWHSSVIRMAAIKNLFVTADKEKWYEKEDNIKEKKIDYPPTTLIYKIENANKTELKKYRHVFIEKVTARWKGLLGREREEFMVMLRFVPPVKSQESAKEQVKDNSPVTA